MHSGLVVRTEQGYALSLPLDSSEECPLDTQLQSVLSDVRERGELFETAINEMPTVFGDAFQELLNIQTIDADSRVVDFHRGELEDLDRFTAGLERDLIEQLVSMGFSME
jgi:hypothetical protein